MTDKIKFAVFDKYETVAESIHKDLVTSFVVYFCVYISQGSNFWTLVTGLMFLLFIFSKVSSSMEKNNTFRTKEELNEWVDKLPDV